MTALAALLAAPVRAASDVYIRGAGNGHGIGMSQYGSYGYALHGKRYRWILAHYYRGTSIGKVSPRRTVRVLVWTGTGTASFAGASRASFTGTHGPAHKRLRPGTTYTARPNADGTIALLRPSGKKLGTFHAPLALDGPGPIQLGGVGSYHGTLELRPDGAGRLQIVDVVGLEDYVRGVISAEMPSSWSAEALKVQAVAARTYAITTSVGGRDFDLYPDTRSQMYRGVAAETPSTDSAVAATRGQVVTYRHAPVVTYFFSSSGGHTENIENVWPGSKAEPWLRGVPDPYDGAGHDPYHRWRTHLTLAGTAAKLGASVKGSLIGIRITRHGVSPRIIVAEIVGTDGSTTVSGTSLQRAFGLLSTDASFTTITTDPGPAPVPAPSVSPAKGSLLAHGAPGSDAVLAIVPLVRALLAGTVPALHGSVFPAPGSRAVQIQLRGRRGWRTVAVTRLGAGGRYGASLPRAGTYRIVYDGLDGPAVTVS